MGLYSMVKCFHCGTGCADDEFEEEALSEDSCNDECTDARCGLCGTKFGSWLHEDDV
jgi:hypothetical protein